jgi:hypothetical protein
MWESLPISEVYVQQRDPPTAVQYGENSDVIVMAAAPDPVVRSAGGRCLSGSNECEQVTGHMLFI